MKYSIPLLITLPLPALAEPEPLQNLSLMQVVTPLLLVIFMIFLLAWLARKLKLGTPVLGQGIKVIASVPLSGQARACLIRVGDRDILLGVTNEQVTQLHTFDEPLEELDTGNPSPELARQFSRFLKGKGKARD
ncbi:MAG: flagellar biosynthetic protein FliO [Endozoicomonas sp.]